jgi:hypothetical protein
LGRSGCRTLGTATQSPEPLAVLPGLDPLRRRRPLQVAAHDRPTLCTVIPEWCERLAISAPLLGQESQLGTLRDERTSKSMSAETATLPGPM